MSEHTPGPWIHSFESIDPEWAVVTTAGGALVANVNADHRQDANTRLIVAAPDLLAAQTMGASKNTPDFLDWLSDRLVSVYGESHGCDFVLSLRGRAAAGRAAIAKAEGRT